MVRDGQARAASFYSNRALPPVILKVMQKHAEISCFFLKEVPYVFCCLAFFLATFIVSCQGAQNNLLLVLNMFETHSGLKTKISAN
jgi:hypothetical protein